ncbi:sulfurtransferase [Pseudanabaena sp. FACHB-2040]|uniref:sulfurtransferase n=1 Tax=Pseudanabaena sp. FACHB-2040 TaxID=2692859 RepID=UPI0016861866|nr:sulfurtransferase [Pseudanabaena sp. FACHB-2040]MBD2260212.1 sulfurtransferase [Pseudanabaena sp. FACHB-2040]
MTYPTNLVEPGWLADHLDDPQVVIVDCRFALMEPEKGRRQYEAGHIPGAHYLDLNQDLSSPVQVHGGRHPLPDWEKFGQKLEAMGVSSALPAGPTLVVAYDDARYAFASRLWWLLKYLGHDAVAVLNGGLQGWQSQGYALSQAVREAGSGKFTPTPRTDWVVDIDTVRRRKDEPGMLLVDAREPSRYRGEQEPIDPVAGSIPGAVNYFWQDVSEGDGRMRSHAELAVHWSTLDDVDDVIVYCGSGVTACVNLLSQAIAGKPTGKLYVGGWSDWCTYL